MTLEARDLRNTAAGRARARRLVLASSVQYRRLSFDESRDSTRTRVLLHRQLRLLACANRTARRFLAAARRRRRLGGRRWCRLLERHGWKRVASVRRSRDG